MPQLSRETFDLLVMVIIAVGLLFALRRLRRDFSGRRWPNDSQDWFRQ
jgi:hypothetical protein